MGTSEQDCRNMNRFVVACAYLACAMGAPTVPLATTGYAGLGAGQIVSAPVASAPAVVGQTHHSYAAGPPVVQNRPDRSGLRCCWSPVRCCRTRDHPPASHLLCCRSSPAPYAAIPPAPRNLGPAPADTVTQTRIAAPVR